jgi:hypothetical protein
VRVCVRVSEEAYTQPWVEGPLAAEHLRSAVALPRFGLASDQLIEDHRRQLFNNTVWYVTEAGGKYTRRLGSGGVLVLEEKVAIPDWRSELRPDHVRRRAVLINGLKGRPAPTPRWCWALPFLVS